ncbi:hypothetical protein ACMU_13770 [Actibacterium mucosum KCTC 23349]|uniref:UDP-N-acetylmuramate--alanine ligase n=1 Tax=Actibacterium mucosum KCTC 23349 TaxID=1454373 RepID=A0A037ZH10_9RHOB|nr:DUF2484 family protein [Actibacterium mucosum]KAJ55750.1 hypothetical protein ACMU_13770 [Actibacterium mucosum KCTC 23349]
MSLSLILLCVWVVVAGVLSMFPSRRHHWPLAYALMAAGAPLLVFIWVENGTGWALITLVVAGLILRWPVIYLARWLRRTLTGS